MPRRRSGAPPMQVIRAAARAAAAAGGARQNNFARRGQKPGGAKEGEDSGSTWCQQPKGTGWQKAGSMAARCDATRDVWDIVADGTLAKLVRQALPSNKTRRQQAHSASARPFPLSPAGALLAPRGKRRGKSLGR